MLDHHPQLRFKMQERFLRKRLEPHKKLCLQQGRMWQIAFTTLLSLGAQELETASPKRSFRRLAAYEMEILHSLAELIDRPHQLAVHAIPRDGSKQEALMSSHLCGQVQAGGIGHDHDR